MNETKAVKEDRKRTLLFDLLLVASVIVVALSVFLFARIFRGDGEHTNVYLGGVLLPYYEGAYAEITQDGELYGRYALAGDFELTPNGGDNVILIKDGKVYMKSATCPDKTCVTRHAAGESKDARTITCLPNRVRIEIIGALSEGENE